MGKGLAQISAYSKSFQGFTPLWRLFLFMPPTFLSRTSINNQDERVNLTISSVETF